MPETTITIERDQRAGLYELVRNHLGSIEDFWIALELVSRQPSLQGGPDEQRC